MGCVSKPGFLSLGIHFSFNKRYKDDSGVDEVKLAVKEGHWPGELLFEGELLETRPVAALKDGCDSLSFSFYCLCVVCECGDGCEGCGYESVVFRPVCLHYGHPFLTFPHVEERYRFARSCPPCLWVSPRHIAFVRNLTKSQLLRCQKDILFPFFL